MKKKMSDPSENYHNTKTLAWANVLMILLILLIMLLFFRYRYERDFIPAAEGRTYRYHFVYVGDSSSFDSAVYQAAKEEGEKHDALIENMGAGLDYSYTKQQQIEIAVATKVDGIIARNENATGTLEGLREAHSSNVPVITVGEDSADSTRESYIGISYYALGYKYGEELAGFAEDGRVKNVRALMTLNKGTKNETYQLQSIMYSGIIDALKKAGRAGAFSIATQTVGDGTHFSAEEDISDIMAGDDLPDILILLDETCTSSACTEIVDHNRVGEVTLIGYYMNDTIRNAIEKKILACTLTVDASKIGVAAAQCLAEYAKTGNVTEYAQIEIERVDSSNIADYAADSGEGGADDETHT